MEPDDPNPHRGCAALPVAGNAAGAVAACPGCGQVQLTLQYLTLRFEPEAFRELAALLAVAQRRLDAGRAGPGAPPARAGAVH